MNKNDHSNVALETPGSWIFSRDVLAWLEKPALVGQFPWLYRRFMQYCRFFFRRNGSEQMPAGSQLFQRLTRLANRLAMPQALALEVGDYRVYLNLRDPRFFQVVNELIGEQADTKVLHRLLQAGDSFFDVGANHGSFSLVAGGILGATGKIFAVEAQPFLAGLVTRSLEATVPCGFVVHSGAVGDRQGEIELLIPLDSSGSAGLFPAHSATHQFHTVKVPLQRFDDLIDPANYRPNGVMKLDIEGSEYNFLQGATQTIQALTPKIILEINPSTLSASGVSGEKFKTLLMDLGYRHYAELHNLEQRQDLGQLTTTSQRNIVVFHGSDGE